MSTYMREPQSSHESSPKRKLDKHFSQFRENFYRDEISYGIDKSMENYSLKKNPSSCPPPARTKDQKI